MLWFRAHGAGMAAFIIALEVALFATLGQTQQYAPSVVAAEFVPYPLYLILPAMTSCVIGLYLDRQPAELETTSARRVTWYRIAFVGGFTLTKCAVVIIALGAIPSPQVSAYVFNTLIFVGLTTALPLPARQTVWIPVAAFYACVFLGVDGDAIAPWAVVATPGASHAKLSSGALAFLLSLAGMIARRRSVHSARC